MGITHFIMNCCWTIGLGFAPAGVAGVGVTSDCQIIVPPMSSGSRLTLWPMTGSFTAMR